jgi:hypothetical protein
MTSSVLLLGGELEMRSYTGVKAKAGGSGQALLLCNIYMLGYKQIFFRKKTRRGDPTGDRQQDPQASRRFTGVLLLGFALCQKQVQTTNTVQYVWHS